MMVPARVLGQPKIFVTRNQTALHNNGELNQMGYPHQFVGRNKNGVTGPAAACCHKFIVLVLDKDDDKRTPSRLQLVIFL
ncbi:hypothetical protein [Sphingobacterium sp. MYb382]|uniref:hypothetical protein n=1 Tax=Sphingobacterium sp. MYb382 TaxID=2745278 RepID=UPI0030A09ED8